MKKNQAAQGFTLIELLVVSSIIVVMVGGAIAGFMNFKDSRAVLSFAQQVQGWYVIAQAKAKVRERPTSGCTEFSGYQVSIAASTITQRAVCTNGAAGTTDVLTIPSGITVSPTGTTIFYSIPVEDVTARQLTYTNLAAPLTVTVTGNGVTEAFTITTAGVIGDVQ